MAVSLSLYSSRRSLASLEVLSFSLPSAVVGRFSITWGSLVMMLARVCKDLPVCLIILAIMREVRRPSPVG